MNRNGNHLDRGLIAALLLTLATALLLLAGPATAAKPKLAIKGAKQAKLLAKGKVTVTVKVANDLAETQRRDESPPRRTRRHRRCGRGDHPPVGLLTA